MRQLLVEMLEEESWIEIVGEATQVSKIRELVQKTVPDGVVVTADEPGRRRVICDESLKGFLAPRIIAVTPHENYAVCYWAARHSRRRNRVIGTRISWRSGKKRRK
jgi:AmiR/NasT family two-component response regulator